MYVEVVLCKQAAKFLEYLLCYCYERTIDCLLEKGQNGNENAGQEIDVTV